MGFIVAENIGKNYQDGGNSRPGVEGGQLCYRADFLRLLRDERVGMGIRISERIFSFFRPANSKGSEIRSRNQSRRGGLHDAA